MRLNENIGLKNCAGGKKALANLFCAGFAWARAIARVSGKGLATYRYYVLTKIFYLNLDQVIIFVIF